MRATGAKACASSAPSDGRRKCDVRRYVGVYVAISLISRRSIHDGVRRGQRYAHACAVRLQCRVLQKTVAQ